MSPDAESWPIACHRCGAQLTPGEGSFYIVKIEAFADPTPPPVDESLALGEISAEIDQLLKRMYDFSEQELMDQVHRRLTLLLCAVCYQQWIDDPTS